MPDIGASGVSTGGEPQLQALQKMLPSIILDTSTAGQYYICFGKGSAVSIGTAIVNTPVGTIKFYIILVNTPFLFYIKNIDDLNVYLDNTRNVLIKNKIKIIPII